MRFKNLKIHSKVILAPMAGITDSPFRSICREKGAGLVFTEMISADGLVRGNERTLDYLFFREEERPIGFQLFGSETDIMARAVDIVAPYRPDFIDINFGCPVKKVVKRNAGSALMRDIPLLQQIAEAAVQNSPVPVFAKIRKGWDDTRINGIDVAKLLEQLGVSAVTIHARTKAEQFRGHSDWAFIRQLKNEINIPVIGSGDVFSAEDAKRMLNETGCDMVMIGRACLGNPWIFEQVNHFLIVGQSLPQPSLSERLDVISRHLRGMIELKGMERGVREMRKHIGWYVKGLPECSKLKSKLYTFKTENQVIESLHSYFKKISDYEQQNILLSHQTIPA